WDETQRMILWRDNFEIAINEFGLRGDGLPVILVKHGGDGVHTAGCGYHSLCAAVGGHFAET
ncbi:hypothetical protein LCGC14_2419090, partial [marine sediment metagenome]